jgi:hypothetical protein
MLPPLLPLTAIPIGGPLAARVGDHGALIVVRLVGGDGGYVHLPCGSAITLLAVEKPDAPLRERRERRRFGRVAALDPEDASLVRYVLRPGDTSSAGTFDLALTVTYTTGEILTWPSSPDSPYGLTMTIA